MNNGNNTTATANNINTNNTSIPEAAWEEAARLGAASLAAWREAAVASHPAAVAAWEATTAGKSAEVNHRRWEMACGILGPLGYTPLQVAEAMEGKLNFCWAAWMSMSYRHRQGVDPAWRKGVHERVWGLAAARGEALQAQVGGMDSHWPTALEFLLGGERVANAGVYPWGSRPHNYEWAQGVKPARWREKAFADHPNDPWAGVAEVARIEAEIAAREEAKRAAEAKKRGDGGGGYYALLAFQDGDEFCGD